MTALQYAEEEAKGNPFCEQFLTGHIVVVAMLKEQTASGGRK
jgi:hypothetical protein